MSAKLSSERLVFVPYIGSLVTPEHVAWLNDKEVVKYSEQRHLKHTEETQHEYLFTFPVHSLIWLIRLREDNSDIGTITAHIDLPNKCANMGILIGRKDLWGKGYGLEAWEAVMDYLETLEVHRVEAGCVYLNKGMLKIFDRSGMKIEGVHWGRFLLDGKFVAQTTAARIYP